MPFTPSHAVVALPFIRTPLVPAAIAIGAMTPDLPLFLRGLPMPYAQTHSFSWVPVTALIALTLLFAWRCVVRPAVRELSPAWLAERLPSQWDAGAAASAVETVAPAAWRGRRAAFALLLAASVVIGVLSHIVWDLFTHEGRAGVGLIPALDDQWGPWLGYKWLQYGSSVVGLVIIAVWAVLWLRRQSPASVDRVFPSWVRVAWWCSLPFALVAAWLIGLAVYGPLTAEFTPAHLAYVVLPFACGLWGLVTLVLCVVVQVVRTRAAAGEG